jgi:sugar lactone lactonase YvrE
MPVDIEIQKAEQMNPIFIPQITVGLAVTEVTANMNVTSQLVRNAARLVAVEVNIFNLKIEKIESTITTVFNEISNSALNNLNPAEVTSQGNFYPPLDEPQVSFSASPDKSQSTAIVKITISISALKIQHLTETLNDLKVYILAAIQNDLNP